MNYKKSHMLLTFGIWTGSIIVFTGLSIGSHGIWIGNLIGAIGTFMMVSAIVQAVLFFKCPKCGRRLNIRGRKIDFCPGCGHKLN